MINMREKPHAVCIPFPAQGHITPMLKLAKILHSRGLHITFVNTEFNHRRLLKSRGPAAFRNLPSFRFETIPDGLPPSQNTDVTQDITSLVKSTSQTCSAPFRDLVLKLNNTPGIPPVSCIVSDGIMCFTLDVAEELGICEVLFWTTSACGFLAYSHYITLVEKGLIPSKDCEYLTNEYLETAIDFIAGMKGMRMKNMPSFVTTTPNAFLFDFLVRVTSRAKDASAIILNTFDALEHHVLNELSSIYTRVYSVGPLHTVAKEIKNDDSHTLSSNLWIEDTECLQWLDSKQPNSVLYVNFGSITVMTAEQLGEFSWGIANSKVNFLWVIRPDLVSGESAVIPPELAEETGGRGLVVSWCPQEKVLNHPAVGGFLTHGGWNSTLESISSGVPMVCWPFFAEQQTNCWYICNQWGIGMEIDGDVKRKQVEDLVRVLMVEERGNEMRKRASEWKKKAETSSSSRLNIDNLISEVLLAPPKQDNMI